VNPVCHIKKKEKTTNQMDGKQGEDSTAKASILAVNQLIYSLQPDLSVAVSRTVVKQYPMGSQKVVSRDTLVFVLNSGSAYVDFKVHNTHTLHM
jgi:hypothetical protein